MLSTGPASRQPPAERLWPGLALVTSGVSVAWGVHTLAPQVGLLTAAVLVGVLTGNVAGTRAGLPGRVGPGVALAARRFLRAGVVLLGLRLSLGDLAELGAASLAAVATIVAATLLGVRWLGSLLGVTRATGLLLAAGYAICGASAVAAVSASTPHEEEDVANAVAMVTLCGSLAIVVLPVLGAWAGLDPVQFGAWVGASVHDVGQVVAAASTGGPQALHEAVVVKLTRVALLAPLVAVVAVAARRAAARAGDRRGHPTAPAPAVVPGFLIGFLAAVVLRSTGWLPDPALAAAELVQTLLLAAALVALGMGVDLRRLLGTGARTVALGLAAWVLVAGLALAAVLTGWLG